MWKKIINVTPQTGYPIQRKAIDVTGRLGALYDASNDNLEDEYSVRASETKTPYPRCISRLYSGVQSNEEIRFLEEIGFDDALRQSILLQMVIPSGVCCLMNYNRPINHNTRFLYYSYRSRIDKIDVVAGKTDEIVIPPSSPNCATHMITEILWGIEMLCVIQIPTNQSVNTVDELLRRICNHLKNNLIPIQFNNDDRHLINQLTDTIVYGSKTCIDNLNIPLLTILNRIQDWQNNTNLHQPLEYTLQPLRWLYNDKQYPELCNWPHQDDAQLDRIEPILIRIKNEIMYLQEMLQNIPKNFSSQILSQKSNDYHEQFDFLLITRDHFQERLRKTLVDIRLLRVKSKEIENIISDQRYTCLHKNEMETFYTKVQQLFKKAILIEEFEKDQIEYINTFDICSDRETSMTKDDIDDILKCSFPAENTSVILWYSSDRLKREQAQRWEAIYQQLISERQQATQTIKLVYADFSQYPQRLEGFIIVKLPLAEIPKTKHDSIVGKKSN